MDIALILILGFIVGSFLNVCIYRIPRKMSIVKPFSFCPSCRNKIKPWHNIPVLSFILLKGRCAYCGEKISVRYPIGESLNGILYGLSYLHFGFDVSLPFVFFFLSSLIVISFIDLDFQIIPDFLSLSLVLAGIIISILPHSAYGLVTQWKESLLGILVGGGSLYLVALLSKGGMGGGDIKLNAGIGAFLGWQKALLTIFIGSLLGAIVGIIILKKTGNRKVPFGPFLSIGAIINLFWGEEILKFYFQ